MSFLYGSDMDTHLGLRNFTGGLLLSTRFNGIAKEYLPIAEPNLCRRLTPFDKCFITGELRTEENIHLTTIQTIFLREHNRIANKLSILNPTCKDETIFQETRKIMIAMFQHIIYKDWLSALLGPELYQEFNLAPLNEGYFMGYDKNIQPYLYNEMATAAFRFGHALVKLEMQKAHPNFTLFEARNTNEFMFSSNKYFKDGLRTPEDYARGLLAEDCYAWRSVNFKF